MNAILEHQEHYREAIERHQGEARAWARDGALSKQARSLRSESQVAKGQQAVERQVASARKHHAEHKRLRRLIALVSPAMALAILIGVLI